ncbi:spore coat U domain-containing protein [Lentibacter algarum]|nr:spore coat U domain-containing protein [Lentibacter algarum]
MASAAEETANLNVSAIVADSCTLTSATALSFASIDSSTASNEITPGSIVVLCTGSRTGATVTLGAGQNEEGGTRKMASTGGDLLPYTVFSDAGHSSAVASGGTVFSGNLTAVVPQAIPVYGQIPPGSYSAGLYTDTILVTLNH